jgi:hypothetical protein
MLHRDLLAVEVVKIMEALVAVAVLGELAVRAETVLYQVSVTLAVVELPS